RMIAARVRIPTTRTMINDQGLDALPPTMHEVVSHRAACEACLLQLLVEPRPEEGHQGVGHEGLPVFCCSRRSSSSDELTILTMV
ncbi:hypothetical protein, partial [Streptomyces globisporus]